MDRGQKSLGTLLLKKVRSKHIRTYIYSQFIHTYGELLVCNSLCHNTLCTCSNGYI